MRGARTEPSAEAHAQRHREDERVLALDEQVEEVGRVAFLHQLGGGLQNLRCRVS